MARFRFIHAADIHLGSILHVDGSDYRQELKDICREATYRALSNMFRIAAEVKARFILISGDLYDSEARSVRANRFFADECRKLADAGIDIYIIAGNHDPSGEYRELFSLPENVHTFRADSPEMQLVRDKDGRELAAIVGRSYQSRQARDPMHLNYPSPDRGIFRIAMLHTQLEAGRSSYVPAALSDLAESQAFDYWALGHIHKPRILRQYKPVIAYPGIPQGRDFGEEGPGGCYLVEVDGTEITGMKYMITSPVIYKSIAIDIGCPELSRADSLDQLEDYLHTCAQKLLFDDISNIEADGSSDAKTEAGSVNSNDSHVIEDLIVRWQITGRGRLHHILTGDRQGSEQELCQYMRDTLLSSKPFLWTDSVEIHTASPVNDAVLSRYPMLKELLDQAFCAIKEDDKVRNRFISTLGKAWTTDFDYEDQNEEKLPLDDDTLDAILKDAAQLLLEGLAEGGEE